MVFLIALAILTTQPAQASGLTSPDRVVSSKPNDGTRGVPDALPINVPIISSEKFDNPKKFFVFHQPGLSFSEALSDLRFCFRYVRLGLWNPAPSFVPWVEGNGLKERDKSDYLGLAGEAVTASVERSARQINQTSCMLPRGYTRYAVSEAIWRQLNGKDTEKALFMQAQIASGPTPTSPRVAP